MQIFTNTKTLNTGIYGMKSNMQFVRTLEDNIRKWGTMNKLISDRAQVDISNFVKGILRVLFIDD